MRKDLPFVHDLPWQRAHTGAAPSGAALRATSGELAIG